MIALLLLTSLVLVAPQTIYQVVTTDARLSSLAAILSDPAYQPIVDLLNDPTQRLTLFGPNNNAIAALPGGLSSSFVTEVLKYHVLNEIVSSSQIQANTLKRTLMSDPAYANVGGGQYVDVQKDSLGNVKVSFGLLSSNVVVADLSATNGIVHIVDTVFSFPQNISATATAAGTFTGLLGALQSTGLNLDSLASITVFPPADPSFSDVSKLLDATNTLRGHVYSGIVFSTGLTAGVITSVAGTSYNLTISQSNNLWYVNGAQITLANILVANGVLHVIDEVLFAPLLSNTITENLISTPQLSGLLGIAGGFPAVVNALNDSTASLTLFAPSNAAVAAAASVFAGLSPSLQQLTLLYHALGTRILSSGIPTGQTLLETVAVGAPIKLNGKGQNLLVNRLSTEIRLIFGNPTSQYVTIDLNSVDIISSNGVIHIITGVLLLPSPLSTTLTNLGLDSLVNALQSQNINLDGVNSLTVFGPTDAGFGKVTGVTNLTYVLQSHVAGAVVWSGALTNGQTVTTLSGASSTVTITGSLFNIDDAQITLPNVLTENGIVHVVDRVLQTAQTDFTIAKNVPLLDLNTLGALVASDSTVFGVLNNPANNLTLFGPTDAAFVAANLPPDLPAATVTAVLTYHAVQGAYPASSLVPATGTLTSVVATALSGKPFVNLGTDPQVVVVEGSSQGVVVNGGGSPPADGASVTVADVRSSNGIIHVVAKVLSVPGNVSSVLEANSLSILLSALEGLNLSDTVNTAPSLTIFAPTDAAFENITATLEKYTDQQAANLLLYHVVGAVAYSTDLSDGQVLVSLYDSNRSHNITVQIRDDGVYLVSEKKGVVAKVVTPNVLTQNGVVHIIDTVLLYSGAAAKAASLYLIAALILAMFI